MKEFNYDTYCGLYCGACDILQAYKQSLETGMPPKWGDFPARFQKNLPFHPKEIRCYGCKTDTVFGGCRFCPIRACARKKGDVEHCWDCKSYPCFKLRIYNLIARLSSIERKLPHQKSKPANQRRICEAGAARWLEEQGKLWSCPDCGTEFSWYRTNCSKCGRELDSLKGFM